MCIISADPRLLGALRKTGGGISNGWKNEWNAFVRVSLRLESRKALEKQYLFRGLRFQLVFFFFVSSLCQETDFYIERVTVHRFKRKEMIIHVFITTCQTQKQN